MDRIYDILVENEALSFHSIIEITREETGLDTNEIEDLVTMWIEFKVFVIGEDGMLRCSCSLFDD